MKVPIFGVNGERRGEIELPTFFNLDPREDLIRRAFVHIQSHSFQPKGRSPNAGDKPGAEYFGTGLGLARVPRIKHPPLRGRAAIAPMTRGGRRPHVTPPEKKIHKKINKKERLLALAHAIAASANREIVSKRGHKVEEVPHIPLIVSDELEEISKTRELRKVLERLGLSKELERVRSGVKIVGGKASWRGRRKKIRKGPLIVYGVNGNITYAARNMLGVDVVSAKDLSIHHLAPGGHMGRLVLWTPSAIKILEERLKGKIKVIAGVK
ncbi:50S ribosomal protein L4 [Candidatus Geothermarchaeota archaeon]|nr:MAG: 50S ribosomal protein L4 [Candidatus Geothermarchaeota archaeon]